MDRSQENGLDKYRNQPCFICGAKPKGMRRESILERYAIVGNARKAIFRPGRWVTFCDRHHPRNWRRSMGISFNFWVQAFAQEYGKTLSEKVAQENWLEMYNANLSAHEALIRIL
jgi:hypothetical protein